MNHINKRIPGLLAAILLSAACDKREDYFLGHNNLPRIIISCQNGIRIDENIVDTIKIDHKRIYHYEIEDEEHLDLAYETTGQDLYLMVKNGTVEYRGLGAGKTQLVLKTKDSFRATDQRTINVETIRNWLPVAKMEIKKIGIASPNEVEIDAGASYDPDQRFGGKIVMYEYELHNYTFKSPLPRIRYIFGSNGQKKIGLRVQDNDEDWSEQIIQYFIIE